MWSGARCASAIGTGMLGPLLQYAEERNIGWTAWRWRLRYSELGMLESWDGYKPTDWGSSS